MTVKQNIISLLEEEKNQSKTLIPNIFLSDKSNNNSLGRLSTESLMEQILLDCQDGVNSSLVNLLKEKPSLFYKVMIKPCALKDKHTNVLNHIIESKNYALLAELIRVGLKDVLKDVFELTQYNVLYTDYPNAILENEKKIVENIRQNNEWDSLLACLIKNNLLPESKIEKFSWAICNKPNSLKLAFDKNYFEKPHAQYWEAGLEKNNCSWIMIDLINSSLLNQLEDFKFFCEKDFGNHGLNQVSRLNKKDCYYFPDFLIFHDLYQDLNHLISINREDLIKWFKSRIFKVKKRDLFTRIYQIFLDYDWLKNWNSIHIQYENPWQFISKNQFINNQEFIEINSLDYALLCQSTQCYRLIESLAGSESLIENELGSDAPRVIKDFLFHQKLSRSLNIKEKIEGKIVKI